MSKSTQPLPDVISDVTPDRTSHLDWVGMEKISLPVQFPIQDGKTVNVTTVSDIFVSLDAEVKGIHMSRLHLNLQQQLANQALTFNRVSGLLESMLHSQKSNSFNASVRFQFDLPLEKPALLSNNSGYQAYPVVLSQRLIAGRSSIELEITIPYSSTCPCSTSLARQLVVQAIEEDFSGDTLNKEELLAWIASANTKLATPHNQRSYAYIKLTIHEHKWPELADLIFQLEDAIGTPVQTAVKREDEQAFAKLNGDNLMFCEDAARKLDGFLNSLDYVADYRFKVEHQESLHAHNAVVIHQKNKEATI